MEEQPVVIDLNKSGDRAVGPATLDEVGEIAEIENEVFPHPRELETLKEAANRPDWALLSAKQDDEIVGHALVTNGELNAIAVKESHRGEGFGGELLEEAIDSARGPYNEIRLKVRTDNEAAISLYREHGFEVKEEIEDFYDNGDDAYHMAKRLDLQKSKDRGMTISEFVGITTEGHTAEAVEGDIFEVVDPENLPFKQGEHIVEVDHVHEAPADKIVHCHDEIGLYYVRKGFSKGEYEASHFGTDGDPSQDADDLYAFLDDLVEAGADVWQVRNGELRTWPDDKSDWAVHDPYYHVIGLSDDEAMAIYEEHEEVEFMHTPEVEKMVSKEMELTVFQIRAPEDGDYEDEILGIGVDFPNHDVYVDWNLEAFEDPLDDAHVSIYGSLEDLAQVTDGEIEEVGKVTTISEAIEMTSKGSLPDECRRCGEKERATGSMLCETCEEQVDKSGYQYPEAAPEDAPDEVKEAVAKFRSAEVSDEVKSNTPLLYWLLGDDTPAYKMSKGDADYKHEPQDGSMCANCEYAYRSNDSGDFICSQIRGEIELDHWCRLWEPTEDAAFEDGLMLSQKMAKDLSVDDLEALDEALMDAYQKQVWPWDLSKAPQMWSSDDEVPDFVQRWVEDVIDHMDPMWDKGFDDIPHAAAIQVHNEIADSLTQSQGWSTQSIANRIQQEFDWLDQDSAEIIARQEVAAILNKAREVAYRARPDADQMVFDWVGPDDAHTTEICTEIKEEIEDRGGAVTLDALKEILEDKAEKYQHRGGTPARVEQLVPHFQCRHTLTTRELDEVR